MIEIILKGLEKEYNQDRIVECITKNTQYTKLAINEYIDTMLSINLPVLLMVYSTEVAYNFTNELRSYGVII